MTRLRDTLLGPQSADRRAMSEFEPVGYSNFGNTTSNPAPRVSHQVRDDIGVEQKSHQRCLCLHSPRGRLRYADRLHWPRRSRM
jgi:hypothetical protein